MAKRSKWKGWIKRSAVDPELLSKFDRYQQRVEVHLKRLQPTGNGTADTLGAHRAALDDVPLTEEEREIYRRLEPESNFRPKEDDRQATEPRPPFDARAWMIENGIDPDEEPHWGVSRVDPDDPEVTIYGVEYRNAVTGTVRFEETSRVRRVAIAVNGGRR